MLVPAFLAAMLNLPEGTDTPLLGSGAFVMLLFSWFLARYFLSRLEASRVVGSRSLEETLDGLGDEASIASMQRLRKLRQTQKGRMRPAFKQLAGRLAAIDLRGMPKRMRNVSSVGDLAGALAPRPAAENPRASSLRNKGSSRWEEGEQALAAKQQPTVDSRIERAVASALPGAVRDAVLFRSICSVAEQQMLAPGDRALEIAVRDQRPRLSVVVVLEGTVEVSTEEAELDTGLCRYTAGQSVTSLLTTLCALSGQAAPLSVRVAAVGGKPAEVLILPTAAYVPLALAHSGFLSQTVRETLGRLDAGLLEVAAHLGLAPSLLQPASVAKGDWHTVEQPAAATVEMLGFARSSVSDSLGVPLPELPDVTMLEADASATPTAKNESSLVLAPAALRIRRLRAGWAGFQPGSLWVVLSGELEVHRKSMVEKVTTQAIPTTP